LSRKYYDCKALLDGVPVSKTVFVRNFWWLHNKLKETCCEAEGDMGMPAYFRFLTLLAFRIFAEQGVDAVILEVGLGGRLDATNVIKQPMVCGVTSLGLDHVEVLGMGLHSSTLAAQRYHFLWDILGQLPGYSDQNGSG
jgi:folylpolyglutamate synthase/dihydropteroate synthase